MKELPWPLNRRMGGEPRPPDSVLALLPRRLPPIVKLTASTVASLLVGFAFALAGFAVIGTAANAIVLTWYLVRVHRDKLVSEPRSPSLRSSVIFYGTLTPVFVFAAVAGAEFNADAFAAFIISIVLLALAVRALHYDYANARGAGRVHRTERPIYYWFLTGTIAFAGWMLLLAVTRELGRATR